MLCSGKRDQCGNWMYKTCDIRLEVSLHHRLTGSLIYDNHEREEKQAVLRNPKMAGRLNAHGTAGPN